MIPVAVIGTEEAYPALGNFKPLAKLLKFPYFPITPFFPWLGPLGALPLPCKVRIRYGEPLNFQADPDISESELHLLIEEVKANLKKEIDKELRIRRGRWFT
jgi:1-acyl-sn-glycerol-3-phosphate acyltransferase